MNKQPNRIYFYTIFVFTFFLPLNFLSAQLQVQCDVYTTMPNSKNKALQIIDSLSNMPFLEKIKNDSLIDYLYCISIKTKDTLIRVNALMFLGEKYFEQSDFDRSKKAFKAIIKMQKVVKCPTSLLSAHNYLSVLYNMEGKSLTAYKHNLAQLEISKTCKLPFSAKIYLNLGEFHYHIKNYEKAEESYLKGVTLIDSLDVEQVEYGWLLHRLGEVYIEQNRNEDALFFLNQAIDYWDKTNNKRGHCFTMTRIALLNSKEEKTQKALEIIEKVFKVSQANNFWLCHIETLFAFGKIYAKSGQYESAIQWLDQAVEISINKSIPYYFKDSYELLAKSYEATNQPMKANQSYKNYLKEIEKELTQEKAITLEWVKKNQDLLINKESLRILKQKEELTYKKLTLQKQLIFLGLILLFFMAWTAHSYFKANKKAVKHQAQLIKLNQTIQKQSEQLKEANTKISYKNDALQLDLVKKLLMLSKQGESIQYIDKQLAKMDKTSESNELRRFITNAKSDSIWDELDLQITQSNSDLFQTLSQKFDNLSQNDLRLCGFLKMNMNTKEIAHLTFKNPDSVKVARSRLRKKLGLTHSNVTISSFLNRL